VLVVALVCVAAVVVEIGATTHFFGLLQPASGAGGPHSNLNPYHELIFAVNSTIAYNSGESGYFPALDGTELCPFHICPKTPVLVTKNGNTSIGIFFYVNVTNTGASDESLGNFTLTTSGADPQLFSLAVFCCYSSSSPSYTEPFSKWTDAAPGAIVGLEGYAYSLTVIPYTGAGGYSLVLGSTSP
jgi:hypothetical protein